MSRTKSQSQGKRNRGNRGKGRKKRRRRPPSAPNRDEWINRWARRSDLDLPPVQVWDWETDTVMGEFDQVPTVLARAGAQAGEKWLWCLHCCRFFQAKHLRFDLVGNWQQCPFEDCGAAGFDLDIYTWDNGKHNGDEGWPESVDQLWHGREYPPRPDGPPPN